MANTTDLMREARKRKYTGTYKSPYYDPVERHERYMRERSAMGIGSKIKNPSIGSSSGSEGRSAMGIGSKIKNPSIGSSSGSGGRSGNGSRKVSKKGRSGRGSNKALSNEIAKLREESSLNTDAQREATMRKINDLREQLNAQVNKLRSANKSEVNVAEIRGNIQILRKNIEESGGDLQTWIQKERAALENRIETAYKKRGVKYNSASSTDKENAAKARDKEVKSRADSIYKSKSKK